MVNAHTPWSTHVRRRGVVHVTRAESVYPTLDPGSVSLVISDGPYGMGKAAWDRQKGPEGLREWYAPHVEAWGRVCADAASVYLWGTQRGVRALQPLMEANGWTWRTSIVWNRQRTIAAMNPRVRPWADVSESCDFYTRGAPFRAKVPGALMNVWTTSITRRDAESIKGPSKTSGAVTWRALHPCQKPVTFYDRIIRASSRPGDLVLEPFGGTLRAAVACEALPDAEARRYVCIEPDEDGRGYVPAALADLDRRMASPGLFGGAV